MSSPEKVRHRTADVDGLEIFYREAGSPELPTLLLLHGFPASSHQFAAVMPALARSAHVVAPDLPGFGMSASPRVDQHAYTFESLARTVEGLLDLLGVRSFVVYLHDFGAPVGYHLATRDPERVRGLVVQNGNAHAEGLGPQWDGAKTYWSDPTEANLAAIPAWLTRDGVQAEYVGGLRDDLRELVAPEGWVLDWERMQRPGNLDAQLALFTDYGRHVSRFDEIAAYHRHHQPPALVLWGRHDPYYDVEEVLAYHRALDRVDAHLLDGAHLLLETHGPECAELIGRFVLDHA